MRKAKIIGTGMAVPDCVVDNHLLARCFTTSDEWITQRTGIKERRVLPSTYRFLQRLAEEPDKAAYVREVFDQRRRRADRRGAHARRPRARGGRDGPQERRAPDRRHRLHHRHDDHSRVRVPPHGGRHVGEVRPHVDPGAEPPAGVLRVRLRAGGGRRVHPDRHLPEGARGRRRGAVDDARVLGSGPRHGRALRRRRRGGRAPVRRRELPERVHLPPPPPGRHDPRQARRRDLRVLDLSDRLEEEDRRRAGPADDERARRSSPTPCGASRRSCGRRWRPTG